jgi:hypothetical protein
MTGCGRLVFEPAISFQPYSRQVDSPSGYEVHVHVPQTQEADEVATPHLRKVVVRLPEGVTVSPSAADGLKGCSDEEIAIHSAAEPMCPGASKIGTVTVDTGILPGPLEGSVYQGTQVPGHLLRIFIIAKGFGVLIKQLGSVDLDQKTGQITTTVDNAPQQPFKDFVLRFKGGSRAPLSNPRTCGKKTTTATLTSWAGQVVTTSDSFVISRDGNGAPCNPHGFSPTFEAGTVNPVAGKSSPFTLTFARGDDDQELKNLTVTPPRGLLANVANVPLCGAVQAAAGTCGVASRIGTVTTGAGPGPQPFFLQGRVYLTGPYKGQPFGLSIVVPAKAGPLDLGNVIVRAAIQVRNDGSLRVVSDPLPSILQGIPLQVRSVNVTVDRKGFMLNPTNCNPMSVKGVIGSLEGAVAHVSSRFQVGDCNALPFKPKMTISVGGKGHTGLHDSTPLTATLTQTHGQAGIRVANVTLPDVLNARLDVVNNACALADFQSGHCEDARAGGAVAVTPLLKHPLRGGVYFVKDPTKPSGALPNLMVALRGQVNIDLKGKIAIPHGSLLATKFDAIPDVPITKFVLRLVAGSHGPVGVAEDLCSKAGRRARVGIGLRGQNGALVHSHEHLVIAGCGGRRK